LKNSQIPDAVVNDIIITENKAISKGQSRMNTQLNVEDLEKKWEEDLEVKIGEFEDFQAITQAKPASKKGRGKKEQAKKQSPLPIAPQQE
jgi:hypothetical protein